jgi:hypothetical protein
VAEVIKAPAATGRVADERVAREVSEMLLRIERDGEAAVREYSRRLDRWDPPSSIMTVLVAKTAGVGHVVTATPPAGGEPPPAVMLHAIATSGADAVLCLGGVRALGGDGVRGSAGPPTGCARPRPRASPSRLALWSARSAHRIPSVLGLPRGPRLSAGHHVVMPVGGVGEH